MMRAIVVALVLVVAAPGNARDTKQVEPGVWVREITYGKSRSAGQLWVYLPDEVRRGKVPVAVIPARGATLLHGARLDPDLDRPHHVAWARAGFGVLAFEVSGARVDEAGEEIPRNDAVRAFVEANAGENDLDAVLTYGFRAFQQADKDRFFLVAEGPAAALALRRASGDDRIRGVILLAPVINATYHVGGHRMAELEPELPGITNYLNFVSPDRSNLLPRCPVFVYHPEDLEYPPLVDALAFAERLQNLGVAVTVVRGSGGAPERLLATEGVARAAEWMRGLEN